MNGEGEDVSTDRRMIDAITARVNQHGELHLDATFTALLLSWLRITERENVALLENVRALRLLLKPITDYGKDAIRATDSAGGDGQQE